MRAIVISSLDRPVDVLEIPDAVPSLHVEILSQRLDAAGVPFEVLPVSRNTTLDQLTCDVERFIDSADDDEEPENP